MGEVLNKLVEDLSDRKKLLRADRNIHTFCLKDKDAEEMILTSFGHLLKGIERKGSLVDISVTVGRRVMQKLKIKRDSVKACHVGWFVIVSYIELGILKYERKHTQNKKTKKNSRYLAYQLEILDREKFNELWEELVEEKEIDLFPTDKPPAHWRSGTHKDGTPIVKRGKGELLKRFNTKDHGKFFDILNKLGDTAWSINKPVYEVFSYFLENKLDKNPLKFHHETDRAKKESLFIEASSIHRLATKHLNNNFYHLYNADFRSRLYPVTAFLHEQSSDNAKGLLLLSKGDPIGEDGFYWLCLHTANTFGYDKDTLDGRVEFTLNNYQDFISYAEDPYSNTGWFEADKPFTFLACCFELLLLENWVSAGNEQEDFVSCLPLAIDGSNNGSQHLAAMSKDEELAPYVNLVPQEEVGDLYAYVGKKVWENLEQLEMQIPSVVYNQFDNVFNEITRLQKQYDEAPSKSEKKVIYWEELQKYRNNNRVLREALFPIYWNRIKDPKIIRKIMKRGVMTLSYGATPYGMGEQIWEDTRGIDDYLSRQEKLWSNQLGRLLYTTSRNNLSKLGQMLFMFETVADRFNEQGKHLEWNSPYTNFPVVQNYRKAVTTRTKLRYGDHELYVHVENWDDSVLNKDSQRLGASPNFVHSLDACHLHMVVLGADYPLSLCHDSFGCTAGNMSHLFNLVREKFVELYEGEPLEYILGQLNCEDLIPQKGSLDIRSVMESDFAFA